MSGLVETSTEEAADAGFGFHGGSGIPGADWDAYQELYAGGTDVFQESERFTADIRAVRLDRCILFDRRVSGIRHERGAHRMDRDGFDHFAFQLVLSGRLDVDVGDGFIAAHPGEAILIDTRRPGRLRFPETHLVTASLARGLVIAAFGAEPEHGHRIGPDHTTAMRDLYARQGISDGPALVLTILESLGAEAPSSTSAWRQRRRRLQTAIVGDWIDANLHRRDIQPDGVARACGLSRAGLYRLMTPQGGLMTEVRKRRLARLEQWLATGDGRGQQEMAEALGFADVSQMVRQFRAAAGVPPGRYRSAGAPARQRWAAWMGELR